MTSFLCSFSYQWITWKLVDFVSYSNTEDTYDIVTKMSMNKILLLRFNSKIRFSWKLAKFSSPWLVFQNNICSSGPAYPLTNQVRFWNFFYTFLSKIASMLVLPSTKLKFDYFVIIGYRRGRLEFNAQLGNLPFVIILSKCKIKLLK